MIKQETLIGTWRSYKMVWESASIKQGEDNYTLLQFSEGNLLFTEAMVGKSAFFEDIKSSWAIYEKEEIAFIILDGIPHYEVVEFELDNMILRAKSGILLYFKREIEEGND